ncbi:hypothetical protein [Rhodopirellula sp. P2]|uniref:hypothetical protein n=1 Tax=Rhodopirellula sp. P2 TaxID=2127060 RepID=UPI002367B6CA|nr:hypothetical protein [Rhodopirellula sp. P2]WDQ17003.1 hypothetical protein PSR62_00270 [Rhodopirellula sp. P2]
MNTPTRFPWIIGLHLLGFLLLAGCEDASNETEGVAQGTNIPMPGESESDYPDLAAVTSDSGSVDTGHPENWIPDPGVPTRITYENGVRIEIISAEAKALIAIEALSGVPVEELAFKHGREPSEVTLWTSQLRENASQLFEDERKPWKE